MFNTTGKMFCGVVGTLLVMSMLVGRIPAATPSAIVPAIGVVAHSTIEKNYKGYELATKRLNNMRSESDKTIQTLIKGIGLPPAEFKEYQQGTRANILVNEPRIKELTDLAQKNMDELKTLYNKTNNKEELTKEQKDRLDLLMKYFQDDKSVAEDIEKTANDTQKKLEAAFAKKIDEEETKEIAAVAKEKKLTLVLRRDIQAGEDNELKFVLWGGTDITSEVLDLLNKDFKENMFDEQPPSDTKK